MSYYYSNYVICNEDAKKKITSPHDSDDFNDLSGYYQDNVLKIDKDKYLVLFDTRGDECQSFIKRFIDTYKGTIWYTIDEELAHQTQYFWDKDSVFLESREIYYTNENQIRIEFSDEKERRPFLIYTITKEGIVVEDILNNRQLNQKLKQKQSETVEECMHNLTKDTTVSSFDQYVIPNIKGIDLMVYIYYNGCSIDINSLDKDESKKANKNKDVKEKYLELVDILNSIISDEFKDVLIPTDNIIETIVKRLKK